MRCVRKEEDIGSQQQSVSLLIGVSISLVPGKTFANAEPEGKCSERRTTGDISMLTGGSREASMSCPSKSCSSMSDSMILR